MSLEIWIAFALASAVLLTIPGPTVMLVVSYALGRGRDSAWATVPGVALGDLTAMTVVAQNVPRYRVLDQLQAELGIEVRAYDVPDAPISVRIIDQPIDRAIAELLPPGSRYVLRVGERDVEPA